MRNWIGLKERYLRDKLPIRLGNLASNLARIKSQYQDVANKESVEMLLQESKYFIEWTAAEAEIERQHGYIIVTKDADFSELSLLLGFPPKVIWIRRGNCSTRDIEMMLKP